MNALSAALEDRIELIRGVMAVTYEMTEPPARPTMLMMVMDVALMLAVFVVHMLGHSQTLRRRP